MKPFPIQVGVLILIALSGCDQFESAPLSGVVHTNAQGMILKDDPADWQPRCGDTGEFCVTPLSPNPVRLGEDTSLKFALSEDAFFSIRIEDEQGRVLEEIKGRRLAMGEHSLALTPQTRRGYEEAIYRLVISVYDAKGGLLFKTYGDLGVHGEA